MKKEEGLFANLKKKTITFKKLKYPIKCPNCPKILNNSFEHNKHFFKHINQTKKNGKIFE